MLNPELHDMRILIVDDERVVISLLEGVLRGQGYNQIKSITDSRRALAEYEDFQPHLILLDLIMPNLDGFAVLKQLRVAVPAGVFQPVLVLTSDVTDEFKIRALTVGATDFLTKPFNLTEVMLRIRNLLQSRRVHDLLADQNRFLEEKVHERTEKLRQALSELEDKQQQIVQQERLRALGELASGIVHDFNNVLALIMGQAELLQMAQKDSHEKEAYSVIITAAQDGAAMINRLREFYRSRKANELREAVNLNDVIKQTVSFTKPKWREQAVGRGIAIRIETELEEVPPIQANATELREMLTNLIFNAVDAMTRDGTITLRTRVKNRQVVLDIADTGAGMSPDVQMRCLEPLFTTKGEKGTGMGLAMVYGTVKRHGGSISLESEPGKGSTFHLYFPCESASPREKVEDALPEKMDGVLRILAIDRELVLLEILAKRLQRDGHQVTAASSAREALKKVRPGLFDLVIANQAMPELTGQEIAVAIKKLDPKIRVVLMTEFRDEESELQQIDSVDFFIGKPVTLATLRQALWHCFKPKML